MSIEKLVTNDKVIDRLKLFAIYFTVALSSWVSGLVVSRLGFYIIFNDSISNEAIVFFCNVIALGFMIVASTATFNFMKKHEKSR